MKRQAICIADLGFGDAGKGTITDYLCRQLNAHIVVRYNGGPQAAHTVVSSDGRHHTFSQFGSGTLLPHVKTLLSRFMLINPLQMLKEERHLSRIGVTDALARTLIDRRTLVITPFQKATNRLREIARAGNRHGSCGEGVGECMADALKYGDVVLYAEDLQDRATVIKKLRFLRDAKRDELAKIWHHVPDTEIVGQEYAVFLDKNCIEDCADVYRYFSNCVEIVDEAKLQELFAQSGSIIFEGAQGVLLDENYGFAPYTTWSTTTFANVQTLLQEYKYSGEVIKIGVLRAYATRHGAGPFLTEDHMLTQSILDQHNTWNNWQQTFRVGYFDLITTRYAKDVLGKLDYLALTHLDRLEAIPEWKICTAYSHRAEDEDMVPFFEQKDDKITKMKVHHPIDLCHQEKLTQRLWSCIPNYETISPRSGRQYTQEDYLGYIERIEEMLGTPVAITSYGPTAGDKKIHRKYWSSDYSFLSNEANAAFHPCG